MSENSNPKYHVDMTAKYTDSNGVVRLSDFKSKKKGLTFNQTFGGMVIFGYSVLKSEIVQKWWDEGKIQSNIERLRKMDIESGGIHGLSRTHALRLYKVISQKLREDQRKGPFTSMDFFTREEAGMLKEVKE